MCVNFNPACHHCADCGEPHRLNEYAVWTNDLWEKFGVGPSYRTKDKTKIDWYNKCCYCYVLCFFCFEQRMGRMAMAEDLMPNPSCNIKWFAIIRERDRFIEANFDVLPDGELKFRG